MGAGSDTLLLKLYRAATDMLGPAVPLWIKSRASKGKEDLARLAERKGLPSQARPQGALVWMHGASVGECTMLLPLIAKMRGSRPDLNILLTSGTVTAAKLMAERLPQGAFHQYVPLDRRKYVKTFLQHWIPDMAIWAESEIWPNLIMQAKARGTTLALINARMSETSLSGWRKRPASAHAIFSCFDLILAADSATANGLSDFARKTIDSIGNLKDAALPLPVNLKKQAALSSRLGSRPVWCAASTHHGEDEIVLAAHEALLNTRPDALLILAPRHPERGDNITELINSMGLTFTARSSGGLPDKGTQVYLFDTIGEMGLAFKMSNVTLMCGSLLAGLSGHNPLEPARLNCAVLSGPHVTSFADIYKDMSGAGAVKIMDKDEDIGGQLSKLFSDKNALELQQTQAKSFCNTRNDVLLRVWDELSPLLPQKRPS